MDIPIYKQIYSEIKGNIVNGVYAVGSLIPTESELQNTYKVSRTTIRKVISILTNEGLLTVKQGFGTTVTSTSTTQSLNKISSITETLVQSGHTVTTRSMYIEQMIAPESVAAMLKLPANTKVYKIQRVQCVDDQPLAYITNYLRSDAVPNLEIYNNQFTSLYSFLKAQYGIELVSAEEKLSAISASFTDAQILNTFVGASLLYSKRLSNTAQGPFEYALVKFAPDKYEYSIQMSGR